MKVQAEKQRKLLKEQQEGLCLEGTGVFYRRQSLKQLLEKDSLRYEDCGKKGVKAEAKQNSLLVDQMFQRRNRGANKK